MTSTESRLYAKRGTIYPKTAKPSLLDDQPKELFDAQRNEAAIAELARLVLPTVKVECQGTTRAQLAFNIAEEFIRMKQQRSDAIIQAFSKKPNRKQAR